MPNQKDNLDDGAPKIGDIVKSIMCPNCNKTVWLTHGLAGNRILQGTCSKCMAMFTMTPWKTKK